MCLAVSINFSLYLELITFRLRYLGNEPPSPGVDPAPDERNGVDEPEEDPPQVVEELLGPGELPPDFLQLDPISWKCEMCLKTSYSGSDFHCLPIS